MLMMSASCYASQLLSSVSCRISCHQPTPNPSYRYCFRKYLAVKKNKRQKAQTREKNAWKGLYVPPPISLRDRVSVFESVEWTEFVLLMAPPLLACVALTVVTANYEHEKERKTQLSVDLAQQQNGEKQNGDET